MMTRKQAENYRHTLNALCALGFSGDEIAALLRIERTLQRWGERECGDGNGCISRDDNTSKPYWLDALTSRKTSIPDAEAGALRRLAKVMAGHRELVAYHQGDCRGCNLYILRRQDIAKGENLNAIYNRGVAVCY